MAFECCTLSPCYIKFAAKFPLIESFIYFKGLKLETTLDDTSAVVEVRMTPCCCC
jgi:hypothetical protein